MRKINDPPKEGYIAPKSFDESHWVKFPELPEIEVEFKPHVFDDGSRGLQSDPPIVISLGILGEFELGPILLTEMEDIPLEEQKAEIRKEVRIAFQSLLFRFAAVALVERGEGLSPIASWYESASRDDADGR